MAVMDTAIREFVAAHERYHYLDQVRTECSSPREREQMHIAILRAYLEVQYRARVIAGLQFSRGLGFAEMN
jgi:hypothetical protein